MGYSAGLYCGAAKKKSRYQSVGTVVARFGKEMPGGRKRASNKTRCIYTEEEEDAEKEVVKRCELGYFSV